MQDRQLYAKILGVEAPWQVIDVQLKPADREVCVHVTHRGDGINCPECGESASGYDTRQRRWRHLPTCQYRTILIADVPRVKCTKCDSIKQIEVPWSDPRSGFTALFEALVIDWLREASISAVADLLDLTWDQVDGIMARAVTRGLARRKHEAPPRMGVDETSFQRRHEYVTVVSDLDTSEVLYVADDRSTSSLDGYFDTLSKDELARIEAVSMDMWVPYIKSTRAHVPDADSKISFDRFHVAKHLGEAVDKVRRKEHREMMGDGDASLKGTKWMWLQNPGTMSRDRRKMFEMAREAAVRTARAWAIKELAANLWQYTTRGWAERGWKRWLAWAQRCKLAPMVAAAKTVRNHLWGIINAVVHRATNAAAESINARIQRVKRMACGFRNRERFRNAIYFHLGGLELHPAKATHTDS